MPSQPSHNYGNWAPASKGVIQRETRDGSALRFRPDGRVSDVHDARRGMDIHRGLNGSRYISVARPDHSRSVFEKGRPGFLERPYHFHGSDFDRRTYVYRGRTYDHFYHTYGFHGLSLHIFAPSAYFGRGYYGWAYNPWSSSIRYRWGWTGRPWYGYYGYYFNPSPVYPSAAFWLTDYIISSDLDRAYTAHQEAGEMNGDASAGAAPLTPEVKQMIADEVRDQLALERDEAQRNAQQQDLDPASSGIGRMLGDAAVGRPHVFVVGSALDVVDNSGMECSLSDGDALALRTATPANASAAELVVLSSKGGQECRKSNHVMISLDQLQEMQNNFRETIDQGLQELQTNQGKGGLPMAPADAQATPASYAAAAPPSDANVAAEIQQQAEGADQAESDVSKAASQNGGAPPTISAGQRIAEVEAILGQPTSKANLGEKVIYNYSGLKVTFIGGRVADVE